ncbi:MAG: NAD(P)-dependent alcohol dehydrogenase [Dehalococcoidia bacterium]|nr:MAG: NAD(P)-dependent alcohol dehydrogenase [Dehalococcoidia bacterium]
MRAVVCTKYGPPEVLQIREVEKPIPKANEILIKVHTSTVTTGDCRIRSFTFARWFWLPGRLLYGLTGPRRKIPGCDFAGEIATVGRNVNKFKVGDQVFGYTKGTSFNSCNAEYKCLHEEGLIAIKPSNMTYEEAAAVPIGGLTALHFLRKGNVKSGVKILIYGASGSVGTFAVQLAKHFGAEVTGVCSSANIEMVKSLGADKVIDYTKKDFTESGDAYDVIFDAVIKTSFSYCKSSLKERGVFLTLDWPFLQALWTSIIGSKKVIIGIAPNRTENLIFLKELIEAGHLRSVIDRTYPIEQIVKAHRHVDQGHKKGNVVMTMTG